MPAIYHFIACYAPVVKQAYYASHLWHAASRGLAACALGARDALVRALGVQAHLLLDLHALRSLRCPEVTSSMRPIIFLC